MMTDNFEDSNTIQNLFSLLDDESIEVQKALKKEILKHSLTFIFSNHEQLTSVSPERQKLLRKLLNELHSELVYQAWKDLVQEGLEDIDLEKAALLITYWVDPEVNLKKIVRHIDAMALEIGERIPLSGHPLSFLDHINYYFFKKYGFQGNSTDYYNPNNLYIHKVLESKQGIPISLSILYILIARRLNLPIYGVPMPAHFILKFDNGEDEIFFDPFYRGKIYSRRECEAYLNHVNATVIDKILNGCSNYEIIQRVLRNLHLMYSSYEEDQQKVNELSEYLEVLRLHYESD